MPLHYFTRKPLTALALLFLALTGTSYGQLPPSYKLDQDWLLNGASFKARARFEADRQGLVLSNGLVSRTWLLTGSGNTISFRNEMDNTELIRAIRPELVLQVNGEVYRVGLDVEQPNHAYIGTEWLAKLDSSSSQWVLKSIDIDTPEERFPWKRTRHHAPDAVWPPQGATVHFHYEFFDPDKLPVSISIHYEMYDGIPALSKWASIKNNGESAINLDTFQIETLAFVPYEDPVEFRKGVAISPPNFHVETDYAFGGFTVKNSRKHSVHWRPDPEWGSQVNWAKQTPCLLEVRPPQGPDQTIAPGDTFETFRAFELVYDSTERERKGLALRRLYRTIAPWVTENPLTLHVVSTDRSVVENAIDQAAECGFEMLSLSFGSGLNMEDETRENYSKFRSLANYAQDKGIHIGGYSLLSSRRIKPDSDNIVNPETGQPGGQTHGFCPALASDWGQSYFRRLNQFFDNTGFLQFTHDGSYPGDIDAAPRPPLQKGATDSQWVQWKIITRFYQKLRSIGAYVRVPDYYFLSGANECGMGYREVNWSLPRLQQQIHTRQNIFDGTWEKTPSMGWMFVPLTQYHGGGAAATIEPLHQNLQHYETMLASNLGAGVQAVYRGHRLYDTEETKAAVIRWVDWFKEHRGILESDIIHSSSQRANAQDLDWFFHANPHLDTPGFLVVFNPTKREIQKEILINLYYSGLREKAVLKVNGESVGLHSINDRQRMKVPVYLSPGEIVSVALSRP